MSKWFRWYEGTCEDGKFRLVARNASVTVATVMGVWAVLLEDASNPEHRGIAVRGEDFYAAILDLTPEDLKRILDEMDDIDLITAHPQEITITKWKERQFETDETDNTNADRQRRWREKHKANGGKRKRNGDVTETKRPDTDTDTDTEKNKNCPDAKASRTKYSAQFDAEFWLPYPRSQNMSKKEAWREWMKLDQSSREAACKAIQPYRKFLSSKPNLETVHACRFLSQRRFDGFNEETPARVFNIRDHLV